MTKVLLISPPFYRLMGSHYNGMHLGLGYIAAVLNKGGHKTQIYNADYYDSDEYIDQRKIFENFGNYKEVLNNIQHPIWEEVRKAIEETKPEFVGIQIYTGTYKSAQNVAHITKSVNPAIKVVVGGTHPTLDPHGTIQFIDYDYAIRGEGEYAFLDILNEVDLCNIKGLSYKNNYVGIVHNHDRKMIEDLDSLPFPLRDKFHTNNGKIDLGSIITSRGCPFKCKYCASPQIRGNRTYYRSVDNVLGEIKSMVVDHGVSFVRFQDDTFTLDKNRVIEICNGIIRGGLNIKWVCDTRVDRLDIDLLKLMKKAGCARIKIGVESGSEEILRRVNKGITIEQIRKAVGLIKEVNIPITVYLMIGFPGERDEDVRKTIRFAEEINADYNSLSVISPYYGTQLYKDLLDSGYAFKTNHWEYFFHQSKEMIMNTHLSPEVVAEFFNLNEKGKGLRV